MNNPHSITDSTTIEAVFNRKTNNSDGFALSQNIVILTKILNSYKNLIFSSFINKKQNFAG